MSTRVNKDKALLAAGDAATAQAGSVIINQGGNAVDAAIAAQFAAFVAEPVLTGPFGGGYAIVASPTIEPVSAQFFASTPGLEQTSSVEQLDFHPLDVNFGPTTQTFHVGRGATAMPWLLPGLIELHRRYGTLPLEVIIKPGQDLALEGIRLSPALAGIFKILEPILMMTEAGRSLFAPTGKLIEAGEIFRSPDMAKLLDAVLRGGSEEATLPLLQAWHPNAGGNLTQADARNSGIAWCQPLCLSFGDKDIHLTPPPTSGGVLIAFGLMLLEAAPPNVWQDETATHRHLLAAMAITHHARTSLLEATQTAALNTEPILDRAFVDKWRPLFDRALTNPLPFSKEPEPQLGSTTHISVIDRHGMTCAITSSNGEGCGHIVPKSGTMANNFMGEEDLHPEGFYQATPGSPLTSMMCPVVVTEKGRPILTLGTGGSNRIRTAILQVLARHIFGKTPMEQAIGAPRLHYEGGTLYLEQRGPSSTLSRQTILAMSQIAPDTVFFDRPNMFFGGVHAAGQQNCSGTDLRRGGAISIIE